MKDINEQLKNALAMGLPLRTRQAGNAIYLIAGNTTQNDIVIAEYPTTQLNEDGLKAIHHIFHRLAMLHNKYTPRTTDSDESAHDEAIRSLHEKWTRKDK